MFEPKLGAWAMGNLFTRLFDKHPSEGAIKAYKDANLIYNLLFCDNLKLYRENFKGEMVSPWVELFSETKENLQKIISDPKWESRVIILAYNELRRLGAKAQRKELFGVIVEVGMDNGLDTLAVYSDYTARYINYTEKMIIRDGTTDTAINDKIAELFQKAQQLVSKIGPWDKERLPPPKRGDARITFLVSDGLYFGQGRFDC
jgi:hypothetical protein